MKVKVESSFFKAGENIHDGDIIEFRDEGWEEVNKTSGKNQMIITAIVPSTLEEKKLSLNNTSKANLIAEYGDDSKQWVGKSARVNILKQMVNKEMRSVIYLTAPNKDLEGNVIVE
jgi:NCAIR mutase (PurE)-related protein